MKSKRLQSILALLATAVAFYAIDCLVVLFFGSKHHDVPWYELGVFADGPGGPLGFLVLVAIFAFALGALIFRKDR